ncbi:MAG: helix-turn-helix domain-containing protein [Oscillospiraceae bacterium]
MENRVYGRIEITLTDAIRKKGISKNRLEYLSETQRTLINKYCNGNVQRLDLAVLARLCTALDCETSDILRFVPPKRD